jgi:adenosylcobinamide kinase/adenosylcobinamide-phosphate guanylyltransferase
MGVKITFITGGARSGKSSFALKEASKFEGQKAYLATAETLDDEMRARVERHKNERGPNWDTYEEPVEITEGLKKIKDKYNVIVLDCLTLWLSNLVCRNLNCDKEVDVLIEMLKNIRAVPGSPLRQTQNSELCKGEAPPRPRSRLFIISNEVGMGIVPENELARRFRDLAGILNQKVAETADEVYLVTAGIAMKIK